MNRLAFLLGFLLLPLAFSLFSCQKEESKTCLEDCSQEEELIFNFGFEGVGLATYSDQVFIGGKDTAFPSHNDWTEWQIDEDGLELLTQFMICDTSNQRTQLSPDPENPSNQVLYYSGGAFYDEGFAPGSYKRGFEFTLNKTDCLSEYHQTCKMYLPKESIDFIKESTHNLNILLFKFSDYKPGQGKDWNYSLEVGIIKELGVGNDLFFSVDSNQWEEAQTATQFSIPTEQWLEIELYILEGNENNGRLYLAITPEGEEKQVLFDLYQATTHPEQSCFDGYKEIQPLAFNLNRSRSVFEDLTRETGLRMEVYWDDWVVHKNKQPQ